MKKTDHELVQAVLDGALDAQAFAAFQQRLRAEPPLRDLYQSYATLHHNLCEEFEGRLLIGQKHPGSSASAPWNRIALAAAAAVALLATAIWLLRPASPDAKASAVVTFSEDSVWKFEGESTPGAEGFDIPAGTLLALDRGTASVKIGGAISGIVEAPARIVYEGPLSMKLDAGRARFHVGSIGRGFTLRTDTLSAVDFGTEFGVLAAADAPDELHVFSGTVELRKPSESKGPKIEAGEAVSVSHSGDVANLKADASMFLASLPVTRPALHDAFDDPGGALDGRKPRYGAGNWQVRHGSPVLTAHGVEGSGFEAFCRLDGLPPDDQQPLLLATMVVGPSDSGPFHGPGWAGFSLFAEGSELVFFGDSFGDDATWSIDVRQNRKPVLPVSAITGPRTVTLMYDSRSGVATLHEGDRPNGPAFVTARLPAGLKPDEARIGSSSGAGIAIRSVDVRTVAAPPAR